MGGSSCGRPRTRRVAGSATATDLPAGVLVPVAPPTPPGSAYWVLLTFWVSQVALRATQLSSHRHQGGCGKVQGAGCKVRGAGCMVHGAWCMLRGAWCRVRGAWCVVRGAWCMVHDAWCMVHGAWCMVERGTRERCEGRGGKEKERLARTRRGKGKGTNLAKREELSLVE
jgi:hypothetical protein